MFLRRTLSTLALVAAILFSIVPAPAGAAENGVSAPAAASSTADDPNVVSCDGGDSEYYLPGSECAQMIADGEALGCTVAWSNEPVGDNADTLTVTCPPAQAVAKVTPAKDFTKETVKNGKCTVGRDVVNGYLRIAGKYFKAGSATMATNFCYNGTTVYKAGTQDEPHHATIQNPQVMSTPFITCTYTGSLDNDFAYGYTDDTKSLFFTTATFGFACTGPALALGVTAGPAQVGVQINNGTVYLTVTQYVRNDGTVTTVMGSRL